MYVRCNTMLRSTLVTAGCLLLAEATQAGLLDRSHEDRPTTSSLKAEILKFKTFECGSSSSEESNESGSSASAENKKKKRRNDDSNSRDYESPGYNYGQSGPGHSPGPDPYQYQDPYAPRNMGRPTYEQYPSRGGLPYPAMEPNPYQRPGGARPYSGRPEGSYADRGTGSYQGRYPYQQGQETFPDRDLYSGARDPRQNRQNGRGHSNKDTKQQRGSRRKSSKKPVKNDSDEECVSQCIFNNMDIMEEDGIPSESAMIKWAQEKIKNDKLKSAAVKEIRKCFGTLASSDGDNSCEFSKSLASCLKLNLDED